VTLPTRLSATYWETELDGKLDTNDFEVRNDGTYDGDVQALEIQVDSDDLEINTVGINSVPEGAARANGDGGNNDGGNNNQLSGTLTAEVTQVGSSGQNQGGDDWEVTMDYSAMEEVTVSAEAANGNSDTGTIVFTISETLNLARGNSNKIYPITVSGENDAGESCSATIERSDGVINVCG
jgi:hypothetical protein